MSDDATTRLNAALEGRYLIERELGEGGMATVYLADDLKHERKVALKVLKPELAAVVGAERFLAEIKTTANLQHPHILPLFDSGEADSFLFYVMPYVEGETLRDRLERERQLPVDEAVRIATDVAEALHAAHEQGVIHRDIKPANILMSKGRPLVADFGIALAVAQAGGGRLTETGLSMGTPFYMSPEQASADREPTPASDVYSVGCVLYEMLVGEPPYTGGSAQAVLAKILTEDARAPTQARASIPANVDAAIRRALEKLPADRFDTAEDFTRALSDPGFRHGATAAVDDAALGRLRMRANLLAGTTAVFALLTGWALFAPEVEPDRPVTRLSVRVPDEQALAGPSRFDLSDDGTLMVFQGPHESAAFQLWVRRWNALEAVPLRGTEAADGPSISPDGSEVAFVQNGALRVTPLQGGVTRTIAEGAVRSLAWDESGEWIYYRSYGGGGLARAPSAGGPSEVVTTLSVGQDTHYFPDVLPGGRGLVFEINQQDTDSVAVLDLETGSVRALFPGEFPRYSPTGHLLFVDDPSLTLMAVPFDAESLDVTGTAVPIADNLPTNAAGWHFYSISQTGRLLVTMLPEGGGGLWSPVWVDRAGIVQMIDPDWRFDPGDNNRGISISPDGTRIAVNLVEPNSNEDIWIKDLPRGAFMRLTTDDVEDVRPRWTPDGTAITYISRRAGDGADVEADVWKMRADGIGEPELLMDADVNVWEAELSPDQEWLAARTGGQSLTVGARDVLVQGAGDTLPRPLILTDFDEKAIALSPDGRWLAYESDETGRDEVYVRPFPGADRKFPVSRQGGVMPVWARTGDELFFVNGDDELVTATFEADSVFRVLDLTALFTLPPSLLFTRSEFYSLYDVSPDDQRFVWLESTLDQPTVELILIDNWAEELQDRGGN